MRHRATLTTRSAGLLAFLVVASAAAAPVVILKMDDLTERGARPGEGVAPRWRAFADACEELGVKASLGVIGSALEDPSPAFVAWVRERNASGRFQIWNHGYTHAEQPPENGRRRAEFVGPDADAQRASIERTQRLAQEKLGITLTAFGSPFNVLDENTELALERVPEIEAWFFGPGKPRHSTKTVLPRFANLEHPTMKPSFDGVQRDFAKQRKRPVLVLQGHPNGWSQAHLEEFRKAVRFLREQGCEFLTPAEYVARTKGASSTTVPPPPPAAAAPTGFPFVIPWDEATPGTATDVSFLNTVPAGANGAIVARDGHFVESSTGRRIRFFGSNLTAAQCFPMHADAEKVAARMAKHGINIVRLHHMDNSWDLERGTGIWSADDPRRQEPDPTQLDRLDYLVAQLKARGIFVNINLKVSKKLTEADGFPPSITKLPYPYDKRVDTFNVRMVELQRDFARRLLTHVNPYTRLSYVDDPAVAMIEINNENSLVGFPSQAPGDGLASLPEPFLGELAALWNDWLAKRYRDDAELADAWRPAVPEHVPSAIIPQTSWSTSCQSGTELTLSFPEGGSAAAVSASPCVAVANVSDTDWHGQLHVAPLELRDGQTYTVAFRAKSSVDRTLRVAAMRGQDDFRQHGLQETVRLGPEWREYRLLFEARATVPGQARLTFNVGRVASSVQIADLSVLPGVQGPILRPDESLAKRSLRVPAQTIGAQRNDWVAFLLDTERRYASDMRRFLRDELGVRVPVVNTQIAWGALTGYAREAEMDYVDAHSYWKHPRFPGRSWDRSNWTIDNTALVDAWAQGALGTLPGLAMTRCAGKPFSVSEYDHAAPNDYAVECVPLLAVFGARQDWDAVFAFEYGTYGQAARTDRIGGFFDHANHPAKFAFYPVAALLFRGGLLDPAASGELLRLPAEPQRRWGNAEAAWRAAKAPVDIERFLSHRWALDPQPRPSVEGPELATHGEEGGPSRVELRKTAAGGVLVAQSASAVVAVGRLGGETLRLDGVSFACRPFARNFGAVALVALDGRPMRTSQRLLLTAVAGAENRNMGWNSDRTSVSNQWGEGPVQVDGVPMDVELLGDGTRRVFALGPDGVRTASVAAVGDEDRMRFTLANEHATVWYEIATP